MTNYFLEVANMPADQGLREVFELSCRYRLAMDWPLPGILADGQLVAVACVSGPESRPEPARFQDAETRLQARLGREAVQRMEAYGRLKERNCPAWPHFYITAVGVRPDQQGRGLGRRLIQHIHRLSIAHPASEGVALDTQSPRNVPLYERLGYRVTAEQQLGPVPCWFMCWDAHRAG
jgi:ribosomal protein S18 acetylase RimI-like enzyme